MFSRSCFNRVSEAAGIGLGCHSGRTFEYLEEERLCTVSYGIGYSLYGERGVQEKMFCCGDTVFL